MKNFTNHEISLNELVPQEFQAPKYRRSLDNLLCGRADKNGLDAKDGKYIDTVKTIIEGDIVTVNGTDEDFEKFVASVKATNWK
jgi:hypothetical protein